MKRIVVLAAMLLLGCEPEVGRIIWLVGDSIASLEIEELHTAAAVGSWRDGMLVPRDRGDLIIPVAAVPTSALGRDLAYFTRRIESVRERGLPADAVVISLGTNDTGSLPPPLETWSRVDTQEELGAAIDALLGSLPPVAVIWLLPGSPASPPERVAHIREGLEAARERWSKLELLEPDPEWYVGVGQDGVHYSNEGTVRAAKEVIGKLDLLFDRD